MINPKLQVIIEPFERLIEGICGNDNDDIFEVDDRVKPLKFYVKPYGDDVSILIGRRGKVVNAFRHLFSLACQRKQLSGILQFEEVNGASGLAEPHRKEKVFNEAALNLLVDDFAYLVLEGVTRTEIKFNQAWDNGQGRWEVWIEPEARMKDTDGIIESLNCVLFPWGRAHRQRVEVLLKK